MGGSRTLIASLGASAVLVATGALSLLALSVVFGFGGWSGPLSQDRDGPALVFADPALPGTAGGHVVATGSKRIVVSAPASGDARRDGRGTDTISPRDGRAPGRPQTSVRPDGPASPPNQNANPNPPQPAPPAAAPPAAPSPPAPAAKPRTGDHVRQIGTSLSSTLRQTGSTLAAVTLPLVPPVSVVVQTALNLVAELARRATGGLGDVLDALLPAR